MGESAVTFEGVGHAYGDVRVLASVSAAFEPGRIHALLGENGAGKSTLLKIGAGLLAPSVGSVCASGRVAYVEQHAALFASLSVHENVALAPRTRSADRCRSALRAVGLAQEDGPVERLSLADRQLVLLARAIHAECAVVLLDEPTALATPQEAARLYGVLRTLADAGCTVAVVTHHLEEVVAFADEVTVLRGGEVAAHARRGALGFDEASLLHAMFGAVPAESARPLAGEGVALTVSDSRGRTIAIRRGEILGVAGMAGQGQSELVRALRFGRAGGFAREGTAAVIALAADRHHDAMVPSASVAVNATLGGFPVRGPLGLVDDDAITRRAAERLEGFAVAMPGLDAPMNALSGGNQQKVVLARVFAEAAAAAGAASQSSRGSGVVLVVAEPTRGIDAAAARLVHVRLGELAREGISVVLVTSDYRELRLLSSRFVVLWKGRFGDEVAATATDDALGAAMATGGEGAGA
jgi:ABC-type sugar transport system ATPase subunit